MNLDYVKYYSPKNGRNDAHGLIRKNLSFLKSYFVSKSKRYKFSCLFNDFEIFVILEILQYFGSSYDSFSVWHEILCLKNGRNGAQGLNTRNLFNFEVNLSIPSFLFLNILIIFLTSYVNCCKPRAWRTKNCVNFQLIYENFILYYINYIRYYKK